MRWWLLFCGCLVAAACASNPASAADAAQLLQAEVRRAVATPYRIDDPDVRGFQLAMDLLLTNKTGQVAYLPVLEHGAPHEEGISIEMAEYRRADGEWVTLFSSLWVDDGKVKAPPCQEVLPRRTEKVLDSSERMVLMKRQLRELGPKPTLRLKLIMYCHKPDGQGRFTWALTEPFSLALPPVP